MRAAFLASLLTLVFSAAAFGQSASPAKSEAHLQQLSVPTGQSTISGCLQGKPDSYMLVERDGTAHLLIGEGNALWAALHHQVQLIGYRDNDRDASASSDEATAYGLRFFQVESVASEGASCK